MKKIILAVFSILSVRSAVSQDMHFSQFTNFSQLYNPALTGQFEQLLRINVGRREQWNGVVNGYETNGLDGQYKLLSNFNDNFLGFGLIALQDKAGKSGIKSLNVKASAAFHMLVNEKNMISSGVQFGYEQRSFDLGGLSWDSQWNGVNYDPTLDDRERFVTTNRNYMDVGVGLNWKTRRRKWRISTGYALFHARQQITIVARGDDRNQLRHVVNGNFIKKYRFVEIQYNYLYQRQAGAQEIMFGLDVNYRIGSDSKFTNRTTSSTIHGGVNVRWSDALHPFIGFDYKKFVGFTFGYDFRFPKIQYLEERPGALEVGIYYSGMPERKRMKIIK
jgi:type IX secretion system PorP/SprF family membrane protein